ncbi:MAG: alkaline phosphatase, partial [Gammaproteobacteria bacterium]|nr:alkaline phosphatase [Gammaproteobacteria bacterium]
PTVEAHAPLASVLEAARLAGKATGLAVTCEVTHATPAGFYAHVSDRGRDDTIMEQLVHAKLDVVLGGGLQRLLPKGAEYRTSFGVPWQGRRGDDLNLLALLRQRGYALVDSRDGLLALDHGPVFGLFAAGHLQPALDRTTFAPHEPTLAECVVKALELLGRDEDGFLLVVEASQVDWGGHQHDPAYQLGDFLAFDEAVRVACDYADTHGSTLVLAFPDHNTGGLSIGHDHAPVGFTTTTVDDLVGPLRRMRRTAGGIERSLADTTRTELRTRVLEFWGVDLSDTQLAEIVSRRKQEGFARSLSNVFCRDHTVLGWTTGGHTGGTVPLWVHGAVAPQRTLENTELARVAARALGVDLEAATAELFAPLPADLGWSLWEEGPDPPALMFNGVELPINRDHAQVAGRRVPLPGLVILSRETGRAYVPRAVLELKDR